jgi:hypothetical protein
MRKLCASDPLLQIQTVRPPFTSDSYWREAVVRGGEESGSNGRAWRLFMLV